MTTTARPVSLPLGQLAELVTGTVLLPGDDGYDLARRIWNADIVREPAAIVQVDSAADVSATIRWCVANDVPLTVRSGGHNLAGTSVADGAVMIDTARLDRVTFDTEARRVTVGAGCRWGDVDRPASELDVAIPAGVVSHTGVAGLTLGGGMGYLSRMYGATVDWVREIEVVLADGSIQRVSEEHLPDLFWGLKGAGHSLGVATEFVFGYVDLPGRATIRQALYGLDDRRAVLEQFRAWGPSAPQNVGTYLRLLAAPPYWSQIPAEHRGRPIVSIATVSYGDPAVEEELTAGAFAVGTPIHTSLRTVPHVTLQHSTDDEFRYGVSHYWKHQSLAHLDDEALDVILTHVDSYPGRPLNSSAFIAHQLMCPMELIAGSTTPRDSSNDSTMGVHGLFSANVGADWEYPGEREPLVAWAREFDAALAPYRAGTYVNFASEAADVAAARALYGGKFERILELKRRYDPDNLFAHSLIELDEPAGAA